MQPLVSIVIPTFNRAHLIGATLDSVLGQSYSNWECFVVDDGSSDNTEEVVGSYCEKDPRIKFLKRPEHRLAGGNAARNYGLEKCNGLYVNFLDSDDQLHPNAIFLKMEMIEKYGSDIVISKHTREFKDLIRGLDEEPKVFESGNFDVDFILKRNSILLGDPLIHKKLLSNVRFDEELKRLQDHEFLIRLFRQQIRYCIINARLYFYNDTPRSITSKTGVGDRTLLNTQLKVFNEMMHHYKDNPKVVEEYKRRSRKMYKSLVKKGKVVHVMENYDFYKRAFSLSFIKFTFFFLLNILFDKGFDKMNMSYTNSHSKF